MHEITFRRWKRNQCHSHKNIKDKVLLITFTFRHLNKLILFGSRTEPGFTGWLPTRNWAQAQDELRGQRSLLYTLCTLAVHCTQSTEPSVRIMTWTKVMQGKLTHYIPIFFLLKMCNNPTNDVICNDGAGTQGNGNVEHEACSNYPRLTIIVTQPPGMNPIRVD